MGRVGLWLALMAVMGTAAFGDGGFFVPKNVTLSQSGSSAAQKGVMVAEGASQVLLLETTYRGPASDFAWVIPVPAAPQEVFTANGEFIDQIFAQTSAIQVDHFVHDTPASPGASRGSGGGGEGEEKPSSLASPARILARMAVGDYDALVFSAGSTADGGAMGLAEWLQSEGYAVPKTFASLLAEYAAKQWVFVALKLQGKVAQERPLLKDVPPIGIRFPRTNARLVFPLLISRLSAPPFTSLALVAISRTGYRCQELEVVRLNGERPISAGETYGAIRRDLCRRPRPALLCEYVAAHPPALSMSYRARLTGSGLSSWL
ncbi:MAG: DUF2330 domain-containing protein, partial [Armatimonadota bacterium]